MNKQYFSVPVKYNNLEQLQADDLKIPVEILVMHDQINLNQSNFDFEVIDNDTTKESIKNIPILGYIKKVDGSDFQDFAGHEMEVVFKNGEIKVTYLERPIGVIPETNSYEYVEKDGKKYVKVIGFLWKDYLNDGYEILQDNPNKSVSMEIVVDAYEVRKDGIVDIKAYRYTGITVLGDNVDPAMDGANMEVIGQFSKNQKFSKEFYERVEKLNEELKNNPSFKISSYFITQEQAEKLVQKASVIFTQLGFECLEYIVDGKEYQITGIINKTLNEDATKVWGFDIYDKDTITIHSLDFETIDTSSVSISSVELLMNKNINTSQQHFTLKLNNSLKGGETEEMKNEGGSQVEEKLLVLEKYNLTIEQLSFSIEELSIEELEEKLQEFSNEENKVASTFSATYRQKRDALSNALDPKIERDEDGNLTYEEYLWVEDFDDTYVYVEKSIWTVSDHEQKYGRFTYIFDETTITASISGEFEEMLLVWLTLEENQKLQDERNTATLVSEEFEALKSKVTEYETSISTLTEQFNSMKSENEALTQSNQSLLEFKSNTETAQQEAFESQQLKLKIELVENFSKVLTAEEIKLVQDKDLSTEEMEKEFKLIYADKDLQAKFNKKPKKIETEIPLNSFACKKKDDWTSCIKK